MRQSFPNASLAFFLHSRLPTRRGRCEWRNGLGKIQPNVELQKKDHSKSQSNCYKVVIISTVDHPDHTSELMWPTNVLHFEERRIILHLPGPWRHYQACWPCPTSPGVSPSPCPWPGPHFSSAWHCQSLPQRQECQSPALLPALPLAGPQTCPVGSFLDRPDKHVVACLWSCLCFCPGWTLVSCCNLFSRLISGPISSASACIPWLDPGAVSLCALSWTVNGPCSAGQMWDGAPWVRTLPVLGCLISQLASLSGAVSRHPSPNSRHFWMFAKTFLIHRSFQKQNPYLYCGKLARVPPSMEKGMVLLWPGFMAVSCLEEQELQKAPAIEGLLSSAWRLVYPYKWLIVFLNAVTIILSRPKCNGRWSGNVSWFHSGESNKCQKGKGSVLGVEQTPSHCTFYHPRPTDKNK